MDIRKFFCGGTDNTAQVPASSSSASDTPKIPTHKRKLSDTDSVSIEDDIGSCLKLKSIPEDEKQRFLELRYQIFKSYNFKGDMINKRAFRYDWLELEQYSSWLIYSPMLKGALCKFCVLFPQPVNRGWQGAFITKEFSRYKDFHESAKNHISSGWHKNAQINASDFLQARKNPKLDIVCQMDSSVLRTVEENRKKLAAILSTILFCGMHDIALRGKKSDSGNVVDLYKFRIDSGDQLLEKHLHAAASNAKYTSVQTEHELLQITETILRRKIVNDANMSVGFSILADETADISGKEQLSLGVRYVTEDGLIKEDFLGFTIIENFDARGIATCILKKCNEVKLNLDKLIGQGYDGCSVMAGKEGGVKAMIQTKYPKAIFVHCASHRLNLVINDLNAVAYIRNSIATIKAIIKFFRESPKRRSRIGPIPLLCETRWTSKYKSIRMFSQNFLEIFEALNDMAKNETGKTAADASQLLAAISTSNFIYSLIVIEKYSSMLEPITQSLQSVEMDLIKAQDHIKVLLGVLETHRQNTEDQFKVISSKVDDLADELGIHLLMPRVCKKQTQRPNFEGTSIHEYYRLSLYVPYLDSIITSLTTRFSERHEDNFALFYLLPNKMKEVGKHDFENYMSKISSIYDIDNLTAEASTWYDVWSGKPGCVPSDLPALVKEAEFFPAVKKAILIAYSLPVTTSTIERSFSTLRRVKTWLRSTMSENRLSGLCMLSVHRQYVNENKEEIINEVINEFGADRRRLQFLFK